MEDKRGVKVEGVHLQVQRVELPAGVSEAKVALVRLRARLSEEQAKRRAAERKVEGLQRGSAELLRTVTMLRDSTREEELAASGRSLRRRELDLERRAAELEARNDELNALGAYLAEQMEVLEEGREGHRAPGASHAAIQERVLGLRESEVVRRELEVKQRSELLGSSQRWERSPAVEPQSIDAAELPEGLAGLDLGALDETTIVALFVNSIQAKSESVRQRLQVQGEIARQVEQNAWTTEAEAQREAIASFEKMLGVEIVLRQHAEAAADQAGRELERITAELRTREAREPDLYRQIDAGEARIAGLEGALALVGADRDRLAAQVEAERDSHEEMRQACETYRCINRASLLRRKEVETNLGLLRTDLLRVQNLVRRKERDAEEAQRVASELQRTVVAAELSGKALETANVGLQRALRASEHSEASLAKRFAVEVGARLEVEERAESLQEDLARLGLRLAACEAARGRAEEMRGIFQTEVRRLGERLKAERVARKDAEGKASKAAEPVAPVALSAASHEGLGGSETGGLGRLSFALPAQDPPLLGLPAGRPRFEAALPDLLGLELRLHFMMKDIDDVREKVRAREAAPPRPDALAGLAATMEALGTETRRAAVRLRTLVTEVCVALNAEIPRVERKAVEFARWVWRSLE